MNANNSFRLFIRPDGDLYCSFFQSIGASVKELFSIINDSVEGLRNEKEVSHPSLDLSIIPRSGKIKRTASLSCLIQINQNKKFHFCCYRFCLLSNNWTHRFCSSSQRWKRRSWTGIAGLCWKSIAAVWWVWLTRSRQTHTHSTWPSPTFETIANPSCRTRDRFNRQVTREGRFRMYIPQWPHRPDSYGYSSCTKRLMHC